MHATKEAIHYILILLGLSFGIGLPISQFIYGEVAFQVFAFGYSFMPAIIALVINYRAGQSWRSLGFIRPHWPSVLRATLIPYLYLPFLVLMPLALGLLSAAQPLPSLGTFILNICISFPILLIFILGEELGWRGYLQARMTKAFGPFKGIALLGYVWGIWHLPLAIQGFNFPDHPWFEAFVFYPIFCTALAFIIAYFAHPGKALIVGLGLHAMHNTLAGNIHYYADFTDPGFKVILFTAWASLIAILAGYAYWKKIQPK